MASIYFKYKTHPGDLFRDDTVHPLPAPVTEREESWIWFLLCYQSDEKVAFLNDLYKYHDQELSEAEEINFEKHHGKMNHTMLFNKIKQVEQELDLESLKNFYRLVKLGRIKVDGDEVCP